MNEKSITVSKTMRYFSIGDPDKANTLIYVLHGYGQLASYFIKSFIDIDEDSYIIAPEGMHRFYLNGTSGRVGASWMTKEARELDIAENTINLDALNFQITNKYSFKKKIIIGFSQGGATAARWFYNGNSNAKNLILWASIFPPDIKINRFINKNNIGVNYFILGRKDPFFIEANSNEIINEYKKNNFLILRYDGEHKIEKTILKKILNKL